ncbi:MAG TPA: glycosyltransferase family 2 protein [Ignavibacteriaceae bacterium]|nr:glycosyltransferase family 2 protein [Ignavibacteriaceae bacterium]
MYKDVLVSVLMPARNEELYIERAIKSVLDQTHKNLELLIINDKSTDRTGEIIKKYTSVDKRVKYLEGSATGVADARNILQAEAKGEYIANADADDFCKPNRIQKLLAKALELVAPCMVGSNFDIYKDGKFLRVETFPEEHSEIKRMLNTTFNRYSISAGQLLGTAFLFKNHPVQNKFKIMSDWDQFLRIQENPDVKLGNVDESLYIYYINSGSMTRRKFERSLYSAFLRDSELRRIKGEKEFISLNDYINNFWKMPKSLAVNSFFITTKYIQQFIVY